MAGEPELEQGIRSRLGDLLDRNGFRRRRGGVRVRELGGTGGVLGWAELDLWIGEGEVTADLRVGVHVQAVERMLAQIRRVRHRRFAAPTWFTLLRRIHPTSGFEIREVGGRWRFRSGRRVDPVLSDLSAAFESSGLALVERIRTLDGLAAEMAGAPGDDALAWRLPLVQMLRGDAAAARAALEDGARRMSRRYVNQAEAYRELALEVMRRIGDAPVEPAPCEELVSALRPALRSAFPGRAGPILAHLVRSFWWEPHPRSPDAAHCGFCGTTEREAPLFGRRLRICDICVGASQVLLHDPLAGGAFRLPSAGRRDAATRSPGPTAETLAADAVRAVRNLAPGDAERLVPEVERRLLRAAADRPPEDVCVVCGPLLPPARPGSGRPCSFCARDGADDTRLLDGGRLSICDRCVDAYYAAVEHDRRLA